MKYIAYLLLFSASIFLITQYDGELKMNQISEETAIQYQQPQMSKSNLSNLSWWQKELLADLRANGVPLSHRIPILEQGVKKIEIFLINTPMASQVPQGAEHIRKDVLEATQEHTYSNDGNKSSFAYYQLSQNTYPKFIELLNTIHTVSFNHFIQDLENKYGGGLSYRDYRLLIEIHYHNQEKVEILTTDVLAGNFLLAKVVQNQQSHYLVMNNKDMDTLMKYVDPEMITWEWARPYI